MHFLHKFLDFPIIFHCLHWLKKYVAKVSTVNVRKRTSLDFEQVVVVIPIRLKSGRQISWNLEA